MGPEPAWAPGARCGCAATNRYRRVRFGLERLSRLTRATDLRGAERLSPPTRATRGALLHDSISASFSRPAPCNPPSRVLRPAHRHETASKTHNPAGGRASLRCLGADTSSSIRRPKRPSVVDTHMGSEAISVPTRRPGFSAGPAPKAMRMARSLQRPPMHRRSLRGWGRRAWRPRQPVRPIRPQPPRFR